MLNVLGLGYPRTGTMSLKHALEILGFGPCYHMIEVFDRPQDIDLWYSALDDVRPWDELFDGFQATADAPGCYFWRQLIEQYPTARCILTIRDSNSWYDSFVSTVYQAVTHPERAPDDQHRRVQHLADKLILKTMLQGQSTSREAAIALYEQHNESIQQAIPPEQLLIFDVSQGWPPLCRFLEVPEPSVEFPKANSRAEFRERFAVQ